MKLSKRGRRRSSRSRRS